MNQQTKPQVPVVLRKSDFDLAGFETRPTLNGTLIFTNPTYNTSIHPRESDKNSITLRELAGLFERNFKLTYGMFRLTVEHPGDNNLYILGLKDPKTDEIVYVTEIKKGLTVTFDTGNMPEGCLDYQLFVRDVYLLHRSVNRFMQRT